MCVCKVLFYKNNQKCLTNVLNAVRTTMRNCPIKMQQDHDQAMAVSNMSEQEVHQGALQRQFFGRTKQLVKAVEMVELTQTKGGMMVVEGAPGEGKTVFMVNVPSDLWLNQLFCLCFGSQHDLLSP